MPDTLFDSLNKDEREAKRGPAEPTGFVPNANRTGEPAKNLPVETFALSQDVTPPT